MLIGNRFPENIGSKEIQQKWPGAFYGQKSESQPSSKSENKCIDYLIGNKITSEQQYGYLFTMAVLRKFKNTLLSCLREIKKILCKLLDNKKWIGSVSKWCSLSLEPSLY